MPTIRVLIPILCITLSAVIAAPPDPIPRILPKSVTLHQPNGKTLADALSVVRNQTGLPVEAAPDVATIPLEWNLPNQPVWSALDALAEKTGTRIVLRDRGRSIALAKRTGPAEFASVDGPFRVVLRQIRSVTDFETGQDYTELTMEIHWEPRLAVVRIDGQPRIEATVDGQERSLIAEGIRTKTAVTGSSFTTTARLPRIPRSAKSLSRVSGTITVTAAERMLRVSVPLEKLPATVTEDGITISVPRTERIEDRFEVHVDLTYPPTTPEFESFETFTAENRAELFTTGNATGRVAKDSEESSNGRRVSAVYRFAGGPGTRLEYTTPSALQEFPVRFTWKNVPLP